MITRLKFKAYLACQDSGVTNMFDVKVVMNITGLSKEECIDIMKNYDKYIEELK